MQRHVNLVSRILRLPSVNEIFSSDGSGLELLLAKSLLLTLLSSPSKVSKSVKDAALLIIVISIDGGLKDLSLAGVVIAAIVPFDEVSSASSDNSTRLGSKSGVADRTSSVLSLSECLGLLLRVYSSSELDLASLNQTLLLFNIGWRDPTVSRVAVFPPAEQELPISYQVLVGLLWSTVCESIQHTYSKVRDIVI